jgi:hypothetical protein
MAFVEGFEFDIFVSYSHVDNDLYTSHNYRWVEKFCDLLKQYLTPAIGKAEVLNVFKDGDKLDGTYVLDTRVENSLRRTAVLICLVSEGYLKSEWCRREREFFNNHVLNDGIGRTFAENTRIIKIFLDPIEENRIPDLLHISTGFKFFGKVEGTDIKHRVDLEDKNSCHTEFVKLSAGLKRLLTEFPKPNFSTSLPLLQPQGLLASSSIITTEDSEQCFKIFFGEVPDNLRRYKRRAVSKLKENGFEVIDNIPPPDEEDKHKERVLEELRTTDMSIHLLDETPGEQLGKSSFAQQQAELSLNADHHKWIWIPSELSSDNISIPIYKNFIHEIESKYSNLQKLDFVKGDPASIADQILQAAFDLKSHRDAVANKEENTILIDTHKLDQSYAHDLSKYLIESSIQPYVNPQDDDPRKNSAMFKERMDITGKILCIYGNVDSNWVTERIKHIIKELINRDLSPQQTKIIIYTLPPFKNVLPAIQTYSFQLKEFNNSKNENLDNTIVRDLITYLKKN